MVRQAHGELSSSRYRGIYEVQAFWCLMLVYLTCTGLRLEHMWKRSRRDYLLVVLRFIIEYWVMISAMLHRPYNVGLLPIQLLVNTVIVVALRRFENRETLIHVHYWLGNVFYFYQVNRDIEILYIRQRKCVIIDFRVTRITYRPSMWRQDMSEWNHTIHSRRAYFWSLIHILHQF